MSLRDLVIPSITVQALNTTFVVQGLGLDAIAFLMRTQLAALQEVYESVTKGELDALDVDALSIGLLEQAPDLAAHVIACAIGESDQVATARKLPFPVQLEILEAAGRLTFASEGGPKKVLETVIRLMESVTNSLASPSDSEIGSGVSESR